MVLIEPLYEGPAFMICAIIQNQKCYTLSFLDSLAVNDQKKIVKLLQKTANDGPPKNEEKFKHLQDKLYEFKSGKVRLICFFDKNKVIITTHGFFKNSQKTPRSEIEKAEKLYKEYSEIKGDL